MSEVRVRYAPSPTGYLHIGGARSALFNYLFAKKFNGKLIFRSEDTDTIRNVEGGEESQYEDLKWLGIVPDESPFEPNPKYAPYRQTERLDIYHKYAQKLLDEGKAYYCYCTNEELEKRKEDQIALGQKATKYDRKCLYLSEEEKAKYIAEGRKPCIRVKLNDHERLEFDDLVRGKMVFSSDDLGGDFVIMKSNGIPTYNFAVVIDDHLMDISHVLRGEEHLSNTAKQLALYEMFGWTPPRFGHVSIIIGKNGKKLSKRDNDVVQFISQYRKLGYTKEAIVNYLILLGWNPENGQEIFSLEEGVKAFDPTRLSSSPSMFDQSKLTWTNSYYIKQMDNQTYLDFIKPFMAKAIDLNKYDDETLLNISLCYKEEIGCGEDIVSPLKSIFNPKALTGEEDKQMVESEDASKVFKEVINELKELNEINVDTVKAMFKNVSLKTGIKGKNLFMPVRLKLTSCPHGIEMVNIIRLLGKEEVIKRLED